MHRETGKSILILSIKMYISFSLYCRFARIYRINRIHTFFNFIRLSLFMKTADYAGKRRSNNPSPKPDADFLLFLVRVSLYNAGRADCWV